MPDITLTVNYEVGLHARPASLFVQTTAKYTSNIDVTHNEITANAKSILAVLILGVQQGSEISINEEGIDADDGLQALEELIKSNFGEE
jgi:phosphotransferase system HPr (HPr) family protein